MIHRGNHRSVAFQIFGLLPEGRIQIAGGCLSVLAVLGAERDSSEGVGELACGAGSHHLVDVVEIIQVVVRRHGHHIGQPCHLISALRTASDACSLIADGNVKAEITNGKVGFRLSVRYRSDNRAGVVRSVDDNRTRNGEFVTAGRRKGQLFNRCVQLFLGIHQHRIQPLGCFRTDKADGKSVVLVIGLAIVFLDVGKRSEVLHNITVAVLVRSGFVQMVERYVVVIVHRIVVSDVVVEDCKSVLGEQERSQLLGVIRNGRIGARSCSSVFRIVDINERIRCGIVDVVEQCFGDQRVSTGFHRSVLQILDGSSVAVQPEYRPIVFIDVGVNNLLVKHVNRIENVASRLHDTDLAIERSLSSAVLVGQKDVTVLQRVGCLFVDVDDFVLGFARFDSEHGCAAETVKRYIDALEHLIVHNQIGLSVLFAPQIAGVVLQKEVISSVGCGNLHIVAVLQIHTDDLSAVIVGIGCGKAEAIQHQNPVLGIGRSKCTAVCFVVEEHIILAGHRTHQHLKADCRLLRAFRLFVGNKEINREAGKRSSAGRGNRSLVGFDRLRFAVNRNNIVAGAGFRTPDQVQLTVNLSVLFHHIINRRGRCVRNESLIRVVQIKIQCPIRKCNGRSSVLHRASAEDSLSVNLIQCKSCHNGQLCTVFAGIGRGIVNRFHFVRIGQPEVDAVGSRGRIQHQDAGFYLGEINRGIEYLHAFRKLDVLGKGKGVSAGFAVVGHRAGCNLVELLALIVTVNRHSAEILAVKDKERRIVSTLPILVIVLRINRRQHFNRSDLLLLGVAVRFGGINQNILCRNGNHEVVQNAVRIRKGQDGAAQRRLLCGEEPGNGLVSLGIGRGAHSVQRQHRAVRQPIADINGSIVDHIAKFAVNLHQAKHTRHRSLRIHQCDGLLFRVIDVVEGSGRTSLIVGCHAKAVKRQIPDGISVGIGVDNNPIPAYGEAKDLSECDFALVPNLKRQSFLVFHRDISDHERDLRSLQFALGEGCHHVSVIVKVELALGVGGHRIRFVLLNGIGNTVRSVQINLNQLVKTLPGAHLIERCRNFLTGNIAEQEGLSVGVQSAFRDVGIREQNHILVQNSLEVNIRTAQVHRILLRPGNVQNVASAKEIGIFLAPDRIQRHIAVCRQLLHGGRLFVIEMSVHQMGGIFDLAVRAQRPSLKEVPIRLKGNERQRRFDTVDQALGLSLLA